MTKGCNSVYAWRVNETAVGANNLQPVSCNQYIKALEEALTAVSLTPQNSVAYKYNPVRAVQTSLGIESFQNRKEL